MRFFITAILALSTYQARAIDTVQNLDVNQYLGFWHQLAAIPQNFAKDCVRNSSAEYSLLEDGTIEVLNSCEQEDGTVSVAEGRARVNDKFKTPSKLEVTFVKALGNWIWAFSGDYWVIDLESNYQWALVGHPELSGLYILSREPALSNDVLKAMRDKVEAVGYDSCDILMTPTPKGSFEGGERFCDLVL